eukprot:TRINITY_DN4892_c0_g1_i1.p1 TRINITY_DN4892_c0_g1~~TRINITY_DN4892_c0_g1_i1.p1  ORF type:complete len:542 (+),score=114.81 TRINITY_DN4892_c0_g1_i1:110-1735(+)
MAEGKTGVVVKNTFLEVGHQRPLLEEDGWRRQMSEPVKVDSKHGFDLDSDLDDDFEEDEGLKQPTLSSSSTGPARPDPGLSAFLAPLPPAPASASKPSQAPAQPQAQAAPAAAGQQQRQNNRQHSTAIHQLKNNDITSKEPPWVDVTTVMMRNLPNKYRQQMLLDELVDAGFAVQVDFDFFYLPMDHSNAANLGYCFINFVEPHLANAFASAFQGKKMRRFNSNKTVVVMPASIQGYERNYKYYSSTRVAQAEDPAYRPLFLKHTSASAEFQEDRRGSSKGGGKAPEKGKGGKKSKAGGKGSSADGRGVEALNRLAFMGLDKPPGGCQGDWDGAWQPQQMQPQMGMGMMQPMKREPQICTNCGNTVSPDHRFCSSCGAPVPSKGPPGPASGRGPQMHAGYLAAQGVPMGGMAGMCGMGAMGCGIGPCGLRADAPSFMPNGSQDHMMMQGMPGQQQQQMQQQGANGQELPDSVRNELDVMRGRLMLIAALKDIEQRDTDAGPSYMDSAGRSQSLSQGMAGMQQVNMPNGFPLGRQQGDPVQW